MFYRIGKIQCKPGKSDDVISYFKSGQDEISGIAIWESKETLEANAERVQSVMGGLMDYVTAPPEIVEGDLEYQFKGK